MKYDLAILLSNDQIQETPTFTIKCCNYDKIIHYATISSCLTVSRFYGMLKIC